MPFFWLSLWKSCLHNTISDFEIIFISWSAQDYLTYAHREYTLERMFANQLLESANDESSFRTVVKELKTKSPMLHIVLINSYSWSCSGYCLGMEDTAESVSKIDLSPVIKVLFSDCSKSAESHLRLVRNCLLTFASRVITLGSSILRHLYTNYNGRS